MAKTIEDLFVYLLFFFDFLILGLFFYFFPKTKAQKPIIALACYVLVDILVNSVRELIDSRPFIYYSYAFFTAFEYSTFAYIIGHSIKSLKIRRLIAFANVAYVVFIAIYYITAKPRSIDSLPIGVETILILIYSFYYFYEQMNDNTTSLFIYNRYPFWIITGALIYLAGSFFIYIFANQVDRATLDRFWFLTMAFYVVQCIFFVISIFILTRVKSRNLQLFVN